MKILLIELENVKCLTPLKQCIYLGPATLHFLPLLALALAPLHVLKLSIEWNRIANPMIENNSSLLSNTCSYLILV